MSLKDLKKSIDNKHGKGSLQIGNEISVVPIIASTGSLKLDLAMGCGGNPKGRILEYYGPPSGGKTTFGLLSLAEVQRQGKIGAFIDVENSFDRTWASNLGVDVDNLLYYSPKEGQAGDVVFDILEQMVKSQEVHFILVDSVSALPTQAILDGDYGDAHIAQLARLMSSGLQKLNNVMSGKACTIAFINQIRHKIGVMFGSPETTSGGNALKFYSSVRLSVRRGEVIGEKENPIGFVTRVKLEKNKVGPPFRKIETKLYIGTDGRFGIDIDEELIDLASTTGMIERLKKDEKTDELIPDPKGGWYRYGDIAVYGQNKFKEAIKQNEKVLTEIKDLVTKTVLSKSKPEIGSFKDEVNKEKIKLMEVTDEQVKKAVEGVETKRKARKKKG